MSPASARWARVREIVLEDPPTGRRTGSMGRGINVIRAQSKTAPPDADNSKPDLTRPSLRLDSMDSYAVLAALVVGFATNFLSSMTV